MSVAAQCPDCCTCPAPTTQWDSRSASKTKSGFSEAAGFISTPPKRYFTATGSGIEARDIGGGAILATQSYAGPLTLDVDESPGSSTKFITETNCLIVGGPFTCASTTALGCSSADFDAGLISNRFGVAANSLSATENGSDAGGFSCGQVLWITLSSEYTTADLITNATADLPAYPGTWAGTAGSFRNLSTDELSVAIRESRYRHIFPVPNVSSGACYRLEWVERFIAEAGVALTSAEIITRGVYRPAVSFSGGGGAGGLQLVAIMSSTGTLTGVHILNPGDFDTAPTIIIQAAINGGTTSTGWTATLTGRQVTAVTGGTAGDYLPTGAFSGGGGSGATITFTMDATGGLATSPLGAAGSGYTSAPTLTITPKVSGSTAALVHLHLGTETDQCGVWDGVVPPGYVPATPSTWPVIGDGVNPYFELPVPTADGTTLVANVRAYCDCSACP